MKGSLTACANPPAKLVVLLPAPLLPLPVLSVKLALVLSALPDVGAGTGTGTGTGMGFLPAIGLFAGGAGGAGFFPTGLLAGGGGPAPFLLVPFAGGGGGGGGTDLTAGGGGLAGSSLRYADGTQPCSALSIFLVSHQPFSSLRMMMTTSSLARESSLADWPWKS